MENVEQPGCIVVSAEGTFREVDNTKKRRAEIVILDRRGKTKAETRTFWTDGSGKKMEGHKYYKQGWGVVEASVVKRQREQREVQTIQTWGGVSRNLESVPRCEARAILKVVQVGQVGQMLHIHTDSKTTVQQIRTLIEAGKYNKKRKYKNKKLLQEIIENVVTKEMGMILEWVKGHEVLTRDKENWVSRYKKEGNEMADTEAGRQWRTRWQKKTSP